MSADMNNDGYAAFSWMMMSFRVWIEWWWTFLRSHEGIVPVMEGWRKKAIVGVKETMSGWEMMVEDQEEESREGWWQGVGGAAYEQLKTVMVSRGNYERVEDGWEGW